MRSLLLCALFACGGTPSKPEPPKPRTGDLGVDIANLTAQLPPYIDSVGAGDPDRGFAGYVMVAQHDQVIYRAAYGMADREHQKVPTADTSFRIGSVTKQFTAAAILRLQQDGKLAVTDKVGKYVPEFPGPGKDVTIHQLLTHTAGIQNYTQEPANLARMNDKFTPRQLLELFWDKPLDFPPGTKFSYSNGGYCVLGAIIEKASGMSYAAYLEKALFAPAGLVHTTVGDAAGALDRAEGYEIMDGKLGKAPAIDMSFAYSAGSIRSTASDLVRWHRALSGDTVLGPAARKLLVDTVGLDDYGYAWVHRQLRGHKTLWHNGEINGFRTIYWRVPDADLVVVAWTNVGAVNVDPVGKAAVDAALGDKVTPIAKLERGKMDPAIAARLTGSYQLAAGERDRMVALQLPRHIIESILTAEITATATRLGLKPNGQDAVELEPLADGTFYDSEHQIKIVFVLPPAGHASSMSLGQGNLTIQYTASP